MNKSCGGCKNWLKTKLAGKSSGFCDHRDLFCKSDHVCNLWKGKKYKRINKSQHTEFE